MSLSWRNKMVPLLVNSISLVSRIDRVEFAISRFRCRQCSLRSGGAAGLIQINGCRHARWIDCSLRKARRSAFRHINGGETMTRLIAVAFALAFASSAQAFSPAPTQQPDELIIKVRQACGAGMHMVNGVCVRTPARRSASRCARGVTC